MPLQIYRRHLKGCKKGHARYDRKSSNCVCPIWAEGQLDRWVKQSLKTSNWAQASKRILTAEARGIWDDDRVADTLTLSVAIERYLEDARSRRLPEKTVNAFRLDLERMNAFCAERSITEPAGVTTDLLSQLRATWSDVRPRTAARRLTFIRMFFRFCMDREWISRNAAKPLKPPKIRDTPRVPYSTEEMTGILANCTKVGSVHVHGETVKTFILLLRYSGLRMLDACNVTPKQIDWDRGTLLVYTQKSGQPVNIALPRMLLDRLKETPTPGGHYFHFSQTRKGLAYFWRRKILQVTKRAGISDGMAHRFRHTFAIDLLLAGIPIESVSILLGHSSTLITQKHYGSWVKSRQDLLNEQIAKIWEREQAS